MTSWTASHHSSMYSTLFINAWKLLQADPRSAAVCRLGFAVARLARSRSPWHDLWEDTHTYLADAFQAGQTRCG